MTVLLTCRGSRTVFIQADPAKSFPASESKVTVNVALEKLQDNDSSPEVAEFYGGNNCACIFHGARLRVGLIAVIREERTPVLGKTVRTKRTPGMRFVLAYESKCRTSSIAEGGPVALSC